MRIKTAFLGLLAAIAMMIPVLAAGAAGNNGHPIANSVAFYNTKSPPAGLFANWTHNTLSFGVTDNTNLLTIVGMRIDAAQGKRRASTFQFDINSTNGNNPFIQVWASEASASAPSLYINDSLSDLGSNDGFTFRNLHNGFTRVTFNAAGNSDFDSNTGFNGIYIADFRFCGGSFQDAVSNVSVNSVPAFYNIQQKPEFDSTLDFDF